MASLQPVRGTHDILPDEFRRHRRVIETARHTASLYGFEQVATPIFEFTDVFRRTLGDTSDVVTKEMYTFEDRGGEQVTLRPEATAGIARAFISGGLAQDLPLKFFTHGPMFRYERPQKGRLRQFHQIDVEILGVSEPQADIEVIAVGAHILDELGVRDKTKLELNTLGDTESRDAYRAVLVEYLNDHKDKLSEDSKDRLTRNPLRILDSKDEGDRRIVADAPLFPDHLTAAAQDFFAEVTGGLDTLGIAYELNPKLVRGLDYYGHTAFEFTTEALGAQGAVIAGGRYDGLIGTMGGTPTPGIGWAGGIERLAMLIGEPTERVRPIAIIPMGDAAQMVALKMAQDLRSDGHYVDIGYRGNLSKRMKRANKLNAHAAVIIGEDELAKGVATVRNFDNGAQEEVELENFSSYFLRAC